MFNKIARIAFVSTLVIILVLTLASASPAWTGNTAYVGTLVNKLKASPDECMSAWLQCEVDAGVVPRAEDISDILDRGCTLTTMQRIGQTLLMTNNRVWPTGTKTGNPNDGDDYLKAQKFRKALFRLIDKDDLWTLYGPLMSVADSWLPPSQTKWVEQDSESEYYAPLPEINRGTGVNLLNQAGFVQGNTNNPKYDSGKDWSAQFLRKDPRTDKDLVPIELLTINRATAPLAYESAQKMADDWCIAGIPVKVVPTSFSAIVTKLTNDDLEDYQIIYPVDIYWGTTAPDNLYDFTYSINLPLWNLAAQNRSMGATTDAQATWDNQADLDYWGNAMMSTLAGVRVVRAVHEIQAILRETEPYLPMFIDRGYAAFTGSWIIPPSSSRGYLGIVNAKGYGALGYSANMGLLSPRGQVWSSNVWAKLLGRADRLDDDVMVWAIPQDVDTLNPLVANTEADWQVLSLVTDVLLQQNPYNQKYMAWAADPEFMNFDPATGYTPKIKSWVGPGRPQMDPPGDGVYNAAVTYAIDPDTGRNELATYNGKAVADVTAADLKGDDQLGMRTAWKLRDKMYWHDSDPGPDRIFDTPDDGVKYQVNTADVTVMMNNILIGQENQRYYSTWYFVNNATAIDTLKFEIYEERQYLFAFECHSDVAVLAPKHIYEGVRGSEMKILIGPDKIWGTPDDIHHKFWRGWENEKYFSCTMHTNWGVCWVTELIGFGPYHYHYIGGGPGAGWNPGEWTRVEPNVCYFGTVSPMGPAAGGGTPGRIRRGDVDLNQLVELPDLSKVIDAFGTSPGTPTWDERADIAYPAQIIDLDDFNVFAAEFGQTWGPYRPSTIPP
jgi:hypothetical protein